MSGAEIGLALSVFLACSVEAVEALTIVLAVGSTRSWPSAMSGVGVATLVLAAIVAGLGPALTALPIDLLRVLVGGLLLTFGLQWLRKAVLRSAGLKAKHDEQQIFEAESEAAQEAGGGLAGFDGYTFTIAFKGVLLEGLEVAFIVLTFGANQHRIALAAGAAGLAVLLVVAAGIAVRAPLARVPENTLKFAVGVMLSSFGTFWGTEGAGARWPGSDAALLVIIPALLITAMVMVRTQRGRSPQGRRGHGLDVHAELGSGKDETWGRLQALLGAAWEFVVGDDWPTALGVVLALAVTAMLATTSISAWWVMPVAVVLLLGVSIRRAAPSDPPPG